MKQSDLFTKTTRQAPKDEITQNAQLLTRAGFVDKLMAGAYSYLPLGLRVLKKIEKIVREEMDAIGGQEILMPALHPSENWKKTGAWDSVDVLFKINSRTKKEYAIAQSCEEVVAPLCKKFISSYKDMPFAVYQIQNKFRDELRAKSGILRGREFGMKDLYSFHVDQEDFEEYYEIVKKAYVTIFHRCGLEVKVTEASGGGFTEKISYEFMVLTDAGEDDILFCDKCIYCINVDIAKSKEGDKCPQCDGKLNKARSSEAGNVFDLGTKYPKDFDIKFSDKDGKEQYPVMGCYGIGTTRLMGTIVEKYNDKQGIIWPMSVAPYAVHLLALGESKEISKEAENLYKKLGEASVEVLFDNREEISPGEKLKDCDLIGIPIRLVISDKTLTKSSVELKLRNEKDSALVKIDQILAKIKPIIDAK